MILNDKIIIVTGGSGLIGREIISDINRKKGVAINADIKVESNLQSGTIHIDITNDSSVQAGIDNVLSEYGRIDG